MIILGADHRGFELKEALKAFLEGNAVDVVDLSPQFVDGDDFPDIAAPVAKRVVKEQVLGLLICGTGTGMSIAANKIKGARAAVCRSAYEAKLARSDDDANILCLGSLVTDKKQGVEILKSFLESSFSSDERFHRRKEKLLQLEN